MTPWSGRGPRKEFCDRQCRARFHTARKNQAASDTLLWLHQVRDEVSTLSGELERLSTRLDGAISRLEQGVTKAARLKGSGE